MVNKRLFIILTLALSACTPTPPQTIQAKPSAPLAIEYDVPKNIQQGEQIETIIRFIAQTDLKQINVKVAAHKGIALLSEVTEVTFTDVKKDETKQLIVSVRLEDTEVGYLKVSAQIINFLGLRSVKVSSIQYGAIGPATRAKMKSHKIEKDSRGRKLIIMPGTEK